MNAQLLQAVLWVLGISVTVLVAVITFIVNWLKGIDARMRETESNQAKFERHTAENYVRGFEIARVEKIIDGFRTEVSHKIDELTKAVYQVVGQSSQK